MRPTKIGRWAALIIAIIIAFSLFYYDYYINSNHSGIPSLNYLLINVVPGLITFILISFIFGYYFDLLSLSPLNPILKYSIFSLGIISISVELLLSIAKAGLEIKYVQYTFYLAAFGIAVFGFMALYEALINALRLKRGNNLHWWKLMLVGLSVGIFSLVITFLLIFILPLLLAAVPH